MFLPHYWITTIPWYPVWRQYMTVMGQFEAVICWWLAVKIVRNINVVFCSEMPGRYFRRFVQEHIYDVDVDLGDRWTWRGNTQIIFYSSKCSFHIITLIVCGKEITIIHSTWIFIHVLKNMPKKYRYAMIVPYDAIIHTCLHIDTMHLFIIMCITSTGAINYGNTSCFLANSTAIEGPIRN